MSTFVLFSPVLLLLLVVVIVVYARHKYRHPRRDAADSYGVESPRREGHGRSGRSKPRDGRRGPGG